MSIALAHKAVAHLVVAISDTDQSLMVELQAFQSFIRVDGDYHYVMLRGPAARELIKIDIANSTDGILNVERGQGGTIAIAWPAGTLLFNSTHEDHYNSIVQRGGRTIDYNPNEVLVPLYAGEKIYQDGPAGCERWWKSFDGINAYWDLITGDKCGNENWTDIGYGYDILITTEKVWTLEQSLTSQIYAFAIVYDATNDILLAGTGNGGQIWKSIDHGETWILKKDLTEPYLACFVHDTTNDVLIAGAGENSGEIWKSINAGETWVLKKDLSLEGTPQWGITTLAYDSFNDVIVAGTFNRGQIWVSDDAGETWTFKKDLFTTDGQGRCPSSCFDSLRNNLFVGTFPDAQIYISSNGGDTWALNKDLSLETPGQQYVTALLYDPVNDILLAGTAQDAQIWKSTNGGTTWVLKKDLSNESPSQRALGSLTYDVARDLFLAGTGDEAQIWESADKGETWTLKIDISDEVPSQSSISSLAYDSVAERPIAGTVPTAQIWVQE
jgi:photosystem II stability/assembly factor-like uncharacterized protein